ncbi:MAG: hypothetical protein KatS3mg110_0128 [Pirellulaceae bacterium]|nr:MAG: hypothetical protein KatS3mg110_0128 [Pirellulaceae bacterium]
MAWQLPPRHGSYETLFPFCPNRPQGPPSCGKAAWSFAAFALCLLTIQPAALPQEAYTVDLLDQQLTRWVVTNADVQCDGSVLTLQAGNGMVRSVHRYRDFVLELEYRPLRSERYDSGIFFRCELPPQGRPWPTRYQINLRDGDGGNLVGISEARGSHLVKRGDWNQIKLTVVGHRASCQINGQQAWQTDKIEPLEGFIALQAEVPDGGPFQFRNVKITELGFRSLFDGTSLAGWQTTGSEPDVWKVEEGLLVCTGRKGSWLRSEEEFGDFNLRLEYRLQAGGNSGVYIRVPEDGRHHGEGAGIEVQILDDQADRYRSLKPYQYSASLYAVVPAEPRVSRPAGQWNTLEIDCRGHSYRIYHNGELVVRAEATTAPELKNRRLVGFLGLQNHSEPVYFRHLRIGPSLQPEDAAVPVTRMLEEPLIDADQTLREVQEFCRQRVARLPQFETAAQWEAYAQTLRRVLRERVVFRGEAAQWANAPLHVEWDEADESLPDYRLRKLRYEALPGLWIPAILYEPKQLAEKAPVFLNVNGHDGAGKAAAYKQIRCINLAKRGILALNVEWFGMGQLRSDGFAHYRMNQLDLCGTSGLAPFVLAMERALDLLLSHPHADSQRVGVAGLSGGGWQTITLAALDTRVRLANPVAGYSSFLTRVEHFSDLGDSEQTPTDLAVHADYTHYTAMLAPRYALLTFNSKDNCCFASGHALPPLLEAARPIYRLLGVEERLRHHVNDDPGTHNFEKDNREALYRAIRAAFYPDDDRFPVTEIVCQEEVRTAAQLEVPLPADNLDFHQLAQRLSADLPADPQTPPAGASSDWVQERRLLLAQLVRYHSEYGWKAELCKESSWRNCQVKYWKLSIGDQWTVPVVEIIPPGARETTIVISEGGRTNVDSQVQQLLDTGTAVAACDLFYWGECAIRRRDFLFALLVNSVGERPVGLQASQLSVVAKWLRAKDPGRPVRLVAVGPRSSLAALVSAGIEENLYNRISLHNSLSSLKQVIDNNWAVNQYPELFCFGLLKHFDIRGMAYLAGADRVQLSNPSPVASGP